MIVISNQFIPSLPKDYVFKSYDEFIKDVLSEDGFDEDGQLMININDLSDIEEEGMTDADLFEALDENENIGWFSINGEMPEFGENAKDPGVQDWGEYMAESEDSSEDVEEEETEDREEVQDLSEKIPEKQTSVRREEPSRQSEKQLQDVDNLFNQFADESDEVIQPEEQSSGGANIIVFGSSKGGTGKTFTSIISTYRYAKTHPNKKIALIDFDLIDGQLGISIHNIKLTMRQYYNEYIAGNQTFDTMKKYVTKNPHFPGNLDFFLAPSNGQVVDDDEFWFNVIENLVENYDLVVFDTGIDYLNIKPISFAYQSADKINLVTTTSIKSVTSVTKQIAKLKGETPNPTYTEEDGLSQRINVIITQMIPGESINNNVVKQLNKAAHVIATFGVITSAVSQAEYFGNWNVFDNNDDINQTLDNIMQL